VGVDISSKMLEVAKTKTATEIEYINSALEDVVFPPKAFDVVISSLAFHYLESFTQIVSKVKSWLSDNGDFVFSVEHPVFTAQGTQDWFKDATGKILHFPVDNYFYQGRREANFLGENVIKYHRTISTYINSLLQENFEITSVVEPQPSQEMIAEIEGMVDELRRPMMLIISSKKK
jgi:SAM-dependent methyltransferase